MMSRVLFYLGVTIAASFIVGVAWVVTSGITYGIDRWLFPLVPVVRLALFLVITFLFAKLDFDARVKRWWRAPEPMTGIEHIIAVLMAVIPAVLRVYIPFLTVTIHTVLP